MKLSELPHTCFRLGRIAIVDQYECMGELNELAQPGFKLISATVTQQPLGGIFLNPFA